MGQDDYDWVEDPTLGRDELLERFMMLEPEPASGPPASYELRKVAFALVELSVETGTFDVVPDLSEGVTFDGRIANAS